MRYFIFLTLFIISLFLAGNAMAQEKHYRVEILVLSHLRHESESLTVERPRDYSNALDFLVVPEPEDEELLPDEGSALEIMDDSASLALTEPELLPVEEEVDPWAEVIHIETRSDIMDEAWRRLRLSAPFRPQQYLSWVQSADEPFPLLRIHNQEVVLVDDPYAELRAELELAAEESIDNDENTVVFTDQGQALPGQEEDEPELPDPTLFYEIDGTVRLIRTRFLHVELDLEIREPEYEPIDPLMTNEIEFVDEDSAPPQPASFKVHKLQQSRQVKTERMEYFDGPVLGVLAYITSFDKSTLDDEQDMISE